MSDKVRNEILLELDRRARVEPSKIPDDKELAQALGADDVPEVQRNLKIMEERGLVELHGTFGPTYAAQITPYGLEVAEELLEERRAEARVFENVETMLGGDLPDLHHSLRKDISNRFAELGASGNRFSSAAVNSAEELGQQQIRHVGRAIIDAWTRALRSFSAHLDTEAVLDEANARLETESHRIGDAVYIMTEGTRWGGREIDLRPTIQKMRKKCCTERSRLSSRTTCLTGKWT